MPTYADTMNLARLTSMPGHFIRRAQQISSALFAEELAQSELTSVQLIALAAIADQPALDATRLADLIDFDKATIGGVIERLERKGLVQRAVSEHDKRVKELSATPEGHALLASSMGGVERVQQRLLAPLSPAERTEFIRMLRVVTAKQEG